MNVNHIDVMRVHFHPIGGIDRMNVIDLSSALLLAFIDFEEVSLFLDQGNLLHIGAANALSRHGGGRGEHPDADDVFVFHGLSIAKREADIKKTPGYPEASFYWCPHP